MLSKFFHFYFFYKNKPIKERKASKWPKAKNTLRT